MFWGRELLFAALLTVFTAFALIAQTPATFSETTPQQSTEQTMRDFERMQATNRQLQESPWIQRPANSILPVLVAIPEFRKATTAFRDAVGANADLREPIREFQKLFKPFDEYFDDLKMRVPQLNEADFKDFSGNDFIWESLTTAERIDNNLQVSLLLLRESERSGSISIKTLQLMKQIQNDMVRFRWLADRASSLRRLSD
jgi:hypothetical protein